MTDAPVVAVLLIAFNRPDLTRRVLERLKLARISRLYVALDGPREGNPNDPARCAAVRRLIEGIDWPCDVKRLFRNENLGCGDAVRSSLDWFFEAETEGIILEDDCIPAQSFFRFCAELLQRYRGEPRIFSISGDAYIRSKRASRSYWFSPVFSGWGWATWRDRWAKIPAQIPTRHPEDLDAQLKSAGLGRHERAYWTPRFAQTCVSTPPESRVDTWDFQVVHHVYSNQMLCIFPFTNMITNVGFGDDSTHWRSAGNTSELSQPYLELGFPLRHPSAVVADVRLYREHLFRRFGVGWRAHTAARLRRWIGPYIPPPLKSAAKSLLSLLVR